MNTPRPIKPASTPDKALPSFAEELALLEILSHGSRELEAGQFRSAADVLEALDRDQD